MEELAGILWRKRRLRLAEAAAHRRGLQEAMLDPYRKMVGAALVHVGAEEQSEKAVEAVRATAEETAEVLADLDAVEPMTRRALDLLGSRRNDAYEAALAALHEDTREWWEETLADAAEEPDEDEEAYTADAAGLRRFWKRRSSLVSHAPAGAGEPATDPGAGVWGGARSRQAGAARPLRGPPRPKA